MFEDLDTLCALIGDPTTNETHHRTRRPSWTTAPAKWYALRLTGSDHETESKFGTLDICKLEPGADNVRMFAERLRDALRLRYIPEMWAELASFTYDKETSQFRAYDHAGNVAAYAEEW